MPGPGFPLTRAAAAPSPKKAHETRFASDASSGWKVRLDSSTATTSAVEPGNARAKSAARASAAAPPTQPSSVIGTRRTFGRNPSSATRYASSEGTMYPVHDTLITRSTSAGATPAPSRHARATWPPSATACRR